MIKKGCREIPNGERYMPTRRCRSRRGKNKLNGGQIYTVKRMRMLDWLCNRGFYPEYSVRDKNNPRYNVWKYKNSPELEEAIDEYFTQLTNK